MHGLVGLLLVPMSMLCYLSAHSGRYVLRPAHAFYFAAYEASKEALGANKDAGHHPLAVSGAGITAAVVNDTCMVPVDVVKQRLQACNLSNLLSLLS